MAVGYHLLKQQSRTKDCLKKISLIPWTERYAEELERGWLLLADSYVEAGKYDVANEYVKRILSYNRSCFRAWELRGVICEKQNLEMEAIDHYRKAWKLGGEREPKIGHKLAVLCYKSRNLVEAIQVSTKILEENPDFPKLQQEVLHKARSALRA
jgi:tetratricopeptide (TPR) repeat protein